MDTSIIISATNAGKKVTKAITNINPEKDNAVLKTFAQMTNALTTNTYVDATRINKESVNEPGGGSTGGGLLNPNLQVTTTAHEFTVDYQGNGTVRIFTNGTEAAEWTTKGTYDYADEKIIALLESDGIYAKDWLAFGM